MSLNSADSSMLTFGGVSANGKTVTYSIGGLLADTTYHFAMSRYRKIGNLTYQSAKTSQFTIITPNIVAPAAPTGFEFDGTITGGGLSFKWDIPEVAVDGYKMWVQCRKGETVFKTWAGDPVPTIRSGGSSLGRFYGVDVSNFGSFTGDCYAWLRAYDVSNNVKVLSNYANIVFKVGY